MKKLDRRDFLKVLGLSGLTAASPFPLRMTHAAEDTYDGMFYVNVFAKGGLDATSFCDPKVNIASEEIINNWAVDEAAGQAGNIAYAPFAANQTFFDKFKDYMLVVNGIDAQTNSHDAGVVHTWSGRLAPGYPSFAALIAAVNAPQAPLALINNGGYRETGGLVRYTRLSDPDTLRRLVLPNIKESNTDKQYFTTSTFERILQYQQDRVLRLQTQANIMPRRAQNLNYLYLARLSSEQLQTFADNIPDELISNREDAGGSAIKSQAQLALTAYLSGICVSCDLTLGGFDTHDTHDEDHASKLTLLTEGIEYLWDTAEELGIADKLVVFIGSDFSRTPRYNDDEGKDHWPIGSAVFMQKNASWGNRVVGVTDEYHNALMINADTLVQDSSNGISLYPKHVQQALRTLGGIQDHEYSLLYPLEAEDLDIFNPSLST